MAFPLRGPLAAAEASSDEPAMPERGAAAASAHPCGPHAGLCGLFLTQMRAERAMEGEGGALRRPLFSGKAGDNSLPVLVVT